MLLFITFISLWSNISHERRSNQTKSIPHARCLLPRVKGSCKRSLKRYYYNNQTRKCRSFRYTGCAGNKNNFKRLRTCKNKCINPSTQPTIIPSIQPTFNPSFQPSTKPSISIVNYNHTHKVTSLHPTCTGMNLIHSINIRPI